jgi:hypothetical protein
MHPWARVVAPAEASQELSEFKPAKVGREPRGLCARRGAKVTATRQAGRESPGSPASRRPA